MNSFKCKVILIGLLLTGYTINGAYQLRIKDKLGSIETGNLADKIVIEKNLFKQEPVQRSEISDTGKINNEQKSFSGR